LISRLISYEGIDGSGKSTQINLLSDWLSEKNIKFIIVREPGGTTVSERIRHILLDKENLKLCSESEIFLFLSARSQLVKEIIRPALEKGKFVICDRFIDSTIAYQGYGRKMEIAQLNNMNEMAVGECVPGQTFLLDVDMETSISRRDGSEDDRMESAGVDFLNRVRNGYIQLVTQNSDRITLLDSREDRTVIFNHIIARMCVLYKELK
jgi:dTMP kinase